jgi:hypothetical protein
MYVLLDNISLIQLNVVCDLLVRSLAGEQSQELPHPVAEWDLFRSSLKALVDESTMNPEQQRTWNPLTGKMEPWVDVKSVTTLYSDGLRKSISGWMRKSFSRPRTQSA